MFSPDQYWQKTKVEIKEWTKTATRVTKDYVSLPDNVAQELTERINNELADVVTASYSRNYITLERNPKYGVPFTAGTTGHPLFMGRILHHLQTTLLPNAMITLEPYKLMAYEKGGHFKPHKDSPVENMVATLLVALPSEHTGGVLHVKEQNGDSIEFDFAALSKDKSKIQWAAFFSDCEHEVKMIESGRRVVFAFRILAVPPHPESYKPLATYAYEETLQQGPLSKKLIPENLQLLTNNINGKIGIVLRHEYGLAGLKPELLKGMDRLVYDHIKSKCHDNTPPRLYSILVKEAADAEYDGDMRYEPKHKRNGDVYILTMQDVYFHAGLIPNKPEKPEDAFGGITFVRGNWCEETNLEAMETPSYEHVGNEAAPGMYKYIYLQSALVVKKEDLK